MNRSVKGWLIAILSFVGLYLWAYIAGHSMKQRPTREFVMIREEHRGYPSGTAFELRGRGWNDSYVFTGKLAMGDPEEMYLDREDHRISHSDVSIPWDSDRNAPACLRHPDSNAFFSWPSTHEGLAYAVFFIILAFKILDCIGKNNWSWMWSIIGYVILIFLIRQGISAYVKSIEECEPRSAVWAKYQTIDGNHIHPLPGNLLDGPWFNNDAIVVLSKEAFVLACLFAVRLMLPAYIGLHYLLVPHPAERYVARKPGTNQVTIDEEGFADSLGQIDINLPPPEFVLRNKTRRVRRITDLLRAEREAAEEVIKHEHVLRTMERDDE